MTLTTSLVNSPVDTLVDPQSNDDGGKSSRPVRNRRYTRRSLVAGQRPQKRLFTPEIKRFLKDWLVRRRENPYPNRDEKKYLAHETGLTYIQANYVKHFELLPALEDTVFKQWSLSPDLAPVVPVYQHDLCTRMHEMSWRQHRICNWFANWRRKLKNVNLDRNQQTWGHLIRTYNDRAQGNVEQFSICSEDSIWSETEHISPSESTDMESEYTDSPETLECHLDESYSSSASKECKIFDNNNEHKEINGDTKAIASPLLLSKWLESAARFQPSETNYSCWADGRRKKSDSKMNTRFVLNTARHDRDEVEAAMALTTLAGANSPLTAL